MRGGPRPTCSHNALLLLPSRSVSIKPTVDELAALSARFELAGIDRLDAELTVAAGSVKRGLSLTGSLEAEVRQVCVLSGRAFPAVVTSSFTCTLLEGDTISSAARLSDSASDDVDLEFAENGVVELGEITAQYLSLELDPYPRAPDESMTSSGVEETVRRAAPPT